MPTRRSKSKAPAKPKPPPKKRDAAGRFVPAKRAPGGGRKKSSPMRQHYTGMQPSRRSQPVVPTAATGALSGKAPPDLGPHGVFLWDLLVTQQQDAVAKGIQPTVGMESYALAHQYASAFDRWAEVKETIKHIESKLRVKDRHLAKWKIDDAGNYELHGVWSVEVTFRKEAAAAAKLLGIGGNHPTVALQVNVNAEKSADDPAMKYIGPYRAGNQTLDGSVVDASTVR